MKKRIFAAILATGICMSAGMMAGAHDAQPTETLENADGAVEIMPFADVIVVKYRTSGGVLQYRRWNETRGVWVDPYWMNV